MNAIFYPCALDGRRLCERADGEVEHFERTAAAGRQMRVSPIAAPSPPGAQIECRRAECG